MATRVRSASRPSRNLSWEVLGQAINEGRISARRAANLLDRTIEDLADLLERHAIEAPLEL
jgi:predicted HTH domain antitoxin